MLPVTVMCVMAGLVVLARRSTAADAAAVDRGAIYLTRLVSLRDALRDEQRLAAFDSRFAALGTTRAVASAAIGVDFAAQIAPARRRAASAIAAMGPRTPLGTATLPVLYAAIDDGRLSSNEAVDQLGTYVTQLDVAVDSEIGALRVKVADVRLGVALDSLHTVIALVDATSPQIVDLGAVWFPGPTDTAQAKAAALTRFAGESADYAGAAAHVRAIGVKPVVASLARAEADPRVGPFTDVVAAALRGEPLTLDGSFDVAKVAAVYRGYLAREDGLDEVIAISTSAVRAEARLLNAAERRGFEKWAIGALLLAVASISVALGLGRSISRPLKGLAVYAHAVNEGDLDASPATSADRGPRETRVALAVFAELVANLQLLDAKANALAECDFDDPVLTEPLPGRLGRSLESSVALLSGSIVERDRLQTHLAYQTTHDSLTGIGNRPAAITGIQAAIHRAARTGATTALLFVDLNDFKAVNDSHGHEVGDAVLRTIARRLRDDLRTADFVARLGGDEFVVVAEGVGGVADATELARRVLDSLTRPIEVASVPGGSITVGAAVGIAMTLEGPEEPLRLLARADAAMYRAKSQEGSAIEIFDAGCSGR